MKQLLNVLYVTHPDAYISAEGMNLAITMEEQTLRRPIHIFDSIVCFGYRGLSPGAIRLCSENRVPVYFVSEYGKYLGSISPPTHGNVLLRKAQYRLSDETQMSLKPARNMIAAKLLNARRLIRAFLKDHPEQEKLRIEKDRLLEQAKEVSRANRLEQVRGIEGLAAREYFAVFDGMLLGDKKEFFLKERSKRPPLDRVNALLSFLYSMTAFEVRSALECTGLDPFVGFLHRDRPGRASLALDLMEELRSFLAEKMIIKLINRKQVTPSNFLEKENGAVLLKDDARKKLLVHWHERKQEEILHPYINETIKIGLIPFVQANLMAKYIRGDIEEYPPFRWR